MFYYPDVLRRHSGCFSTIWLAATRGFRVTRREMLSVNVKRTCQDIVNYVTVQVPPPQPNLPRPQFSLYLSSQLQYGVVVVFHRQCGFLLEEAQRTIDRLLRQKQYFCIDMAESDRLVLDVPDRLHMMEEAEGALDPFFGLMKSQQLLGSFDILEPGEEAVSQHSLVPSPHNTLHSEGFRSPPNAITLTEKEQFVIPAAEHFAGGEIPEATDKDIDMLMDQPEHFLRDDKWRRSRGLEGAMSSVDQLTVLETERGSTRLLGEDWALHAEGPPAATGLETTPPCVALPTPPSETSGREEDNGAAEGSHEGATVAPLKKRRRRQLVFADPHTQISDKEMKRQIRDPRAETGKMVLLDPPSLSKHASSAQLFNAPCGSLFHPDLQQLWRASASIAVTPKTESQHGGGPEQDREILRTDRKRRQSGMKEVPSESGLPPTESSSVFDVMLDASKDERSLSDAIAPVGRWSPQEEAQPAMEPIAEENIEMPEAQAGTESSDMLSWILSSLQGSGGVTFASLLPPEADRAAAAGSLHQLLGLLSARHVSARQPRPFADIIVRPAAGRMAL